MTKLALAAALLLISMKSHAALYCYNGDVEPAVQMEWINGQFTYYGPTEKPVPNPGPSLLPPPLTSFYCWANGPELAYIEANTDLISRSGVAMGPSKSPNKGGNPTVYWTGNDARWIWNNI